MNLKGLLKRFTVEQLKEAIRLRSKLARAEGLEAKKAALLKQVARIDRQLSKLNGGAVTTTTPGKSRRRRWKLSAATRRKMSEAAKRRYAGKGKAETPAPGKKHRSISPEARQKMADAARRRWAKVKAETAEAK